MTSPVIAIFFAFLAGAMAALIAWLSLAPSDSRAVSWMPPWLQNVGHFSCYAVLSGLLSISLYPLGIQPWSSLLAIAMATMFGVAMEWLQHDAPGRTPSLTDGLLNASGAVVGTITARLLLGN